MSLLKCPKCGEMFSDSYKACPFCLEDEEFYNGKKARNPGRRVEHHKSPSILGPAMVVVVLLLVGLLGYTFLGDAIGSIFSGGDDDPGVEDPVDGDEINGDEDQNDGNNDGSDVLPVTITLDQTDLVITAGESAALTAGGAEDIQWSSSDESIAAVDESGNVTAVAPGSATITASASGASSAACVVTVQPSAKDLKLVLEYGADLYSPNEFSLGVGSSTDLKVDGTDSQPTWSITEGGSCASVDQDGVVTGISSGRATLTVTVDGQTITCKVVVN